MLQGSKFYEEYIQLHELTLFSYGVASNILATALPTRQTQERLVELLTPAIGSRGFSLSKQFLLEEVMIRDADLIESWTSTPEQLAWLMVHEELSSFFVPFALKYWEPEPFLVHHIPKAAGTSVNAFLREQGWFVAFPQDTFEIMGESYGSMGFASQLVLFETDYKRERLYIGGHYCLPAMVRRLKLFGKCRGVTLCRDPVDIMSSAVRYVWSLIEQDDHAASETYGIEHVDGVALAWLRKHIGKSASIARRSADAGVGGHLDRRPACAPTP